MFRKRTSGSKKYNERMARAREAKEQIRLSGEKTKLSSAIAIRSPENNC